MSQIPTIFRIFAGSWATIQQRASQEAVKYGFILSQQKSENFRYDGWGLVGFPPRIACNVKYVDFETGNVTDLGRITG